MARSAPAVLIALLAAGCARVPAIGAERAQELTVGAARFRIVYFPEDAATARRIRHALEAAAPRMGRWGGLRDPVTVTIHPTHESLEAAADRSGYAWLHAWARFGTIDLQSPRTWGLLGASDREVQELVTHELTHCAMYQLAGDELSWMYKDIPRWFSEGLASVTAGQGHRYARLADLHAFYQDAAGGSGDGAPRPRPVPATLRGDPIVDPDPIYQEQWRVVYGAAHQAVEFLIARYGEAKVVAILRRMHAGLRFPAAFREAVGIGEAEFTADFRRYVVWEGWRRE